MSVLYVKASQTPVGLPRTNVQDGLKLKTLISSILNWVVFGTATVDGCVNLKDNVAVDGICPAPIVTKFQDIVVLFVNVIGDQFAPLSVLFSNIN